MSDRAFENPYEDYKDDLTVYDSDANKLIDEVEGPLKENFLILLQTMEKHLAAETDASDFTVYTGTSGLALFYMRMTEVKEVGESKDYLQCALSYIEPYIPYLRKKDVTFLCGVAGPLAVAAALLHRKGCTKESLDLARRLENLEKDACGNDCPDELLYGRAGFLYALLFLNKHIGKQEFRDKVIKEVINCIFESGKRMAKKFRNDGKSPLYFEWHNTPYVGAAHGFAGIMYMLLQAKEYLTDEQLNELVKPTVDFVLSLQYPSGNFPSSLDSKSYDKLVHWCHGAPGVIHMLLLAYEVFNEDKYLESARKCSDCIWQRGILKKGYGLCHGVAGNGYAHLRLFQVTKEIKYLHRAVKFAEWCFDYGKHAAKKPDRPYSLFEGFAGCLYFLLDLLEPMNAAFPAFQLF